MASSATEAEATGQELVTADFGGKQWVIPLDVDSWPVDRLPACLAVVDNKVRINHRAVVSVLHGILGEQWDDFLTAAPKRRMLVEASNVFAEAVGIPAVDGHPWDLAFGAIPRLLIDLQHWAAPVEATLHSLGYDYRDRYRFQAGRRKLTLRQIHVALTYEAPFDCPLATARNQGRRPLSDSALVLMDLFEIWRGVPHPSRPLPPGERETREATAKNREEAAVADYRRRHARKSPLDVARQNALNAHSPKEA